MKTRISSVALIARRYPIVFFTFEKTGRRVEEAGGMFLEKDSAASKKINFGKSNKKTKSNSWDFFI
jgi:hypothetical protein